MPKILIFSMSYFPFIGGAEVAVREITRRCTDFNFDLVTNRFDSKLPEFEMIDNVSVYRIGRGKKWEKYFFPWRAVFKALELHKKNNYKIVWGVIETWGGWTALKFKEQNLEVKYLLTLQSGDTDSFIKRRTWFWHWRYKQIYQKADYVQSISKFLTNRARRYGYKGEIELVPNGVDLEKFKAPASLKNNEEKVVITVSRLEEKNGVEYLIRAVKDLPVKLVIVGTGSLEPELKNLAEKLNIKEKVIFTGRVEYGEISKYLVTADIFARPSLSEGLGNVFLEAMAAGLPVIGTPVGGIPDFLVDGETGLFCKVKNPQSLANKIEKLINNEELRNKLIKNGRKLVEKEYNWDKISEKMIVIFSNLMN